jgi:hypothetical protein
MQDKRIDWIRDDVKRSFKYSFVTVDAGTSKYSTLYLSRQRFPYGPQVGNMTDESRVHAFKSAGLRAGFAGIPTEAKIVRILATLPHGIADFPRG